MGVKVNMLTTETLNLFHTVQCIGNIHKRKCSKYSSELKYLRLHHTCIMALASHKCSHVYFNSMGHISVGAMFFLLPFEAQLIISIRSIV